MISTCCQIQQSFCTRVYGQLRVKHQLTQAFSSFAASRFTGADNFSSVLPQVLCDQLQLRAFAAAVFADNGNIFAVIYLHIDIAQQLAAGFIGKFYMLQFYHIGSFIYSRQPLLPFCCSKYYRPRLANMQVICI